MLLVLCAALALSVGVAAATGGNGNGGNSDAAKACQKGGWQNLVGADLTVFKNEGDCVSHVAKGGTLITPSLTETRHECGAGCWMTIVTGSGLKPGSHYNEFDIVLGGLGGGSVLDDGTVFGSLSALCENYFVTGIYAVGTTAAGKPITSNIVTGLC
jgi:hypothetical protein